jgi:hypothetical protein
MALNHSTANNTLTEQLNADNNTSPCHSRRIPLWLVLVDNIPTLLLLLLGFIIIGFALIPAISKLVGCKNCEIKEDCPWMTSRKKTG